MNMAAREEILRVVREVLAPLLKADGAELYLVDLRDDAIALHLAGSYAGCPGNTLATRRIIEPAILAVAPALSITVTAGALVPDGAQRVSD